MIWRFIVDFVEGILLGVAGVFVYYFIYGFLYGRKMKEIKINIFEMIGSNAAVSSEDGELLHRRIVKGLEEKGVKLVLDFTNITLITATFLNAAIGQLYSKYNSPFLRERLKIDNLTQEDLELLKKVVEGAKGFFKEFYELPISTSMSLIASALLLRKNDKS
ncbi:MAG: STAS-like domain-containing protein [bacterium]